ncbi:SpoIIE family protein phosphatase [Streptomyces sp. NPDC056347]|uniref:SpoIIE family protein phosphatase n=1 Tax=Streptomyces sp. NPDC056347 TaxID=3345790 RepID=UPI0035D85DB5
MYRRPHLLRSRPSRQRTPVPARRVGRPVDADESQQQRRGHHRRAGCPHAIGDAVTGRATPACADRPEPALVLPEGTVSFADVLVSPPLGLCGGLPVEIAELSLPEGSRPVLFTHGLVEHRNRGTCLEPLRAALVDGAGSHLGRDMCGNRPRRRAPRPFSATASSCWWLAPNCWPLPA